MIFKYVIRGFTIPATANTPIATFYAAAGMPLKILRIDIGPRGGTAQYQDFQLRKATDAGTGGTEVYATAVEPDWTAAPGALVKKGTWSVNPTLAAADAAGSEGGVWTFNAVGFLPWSPPVPHRIKPEERWALCTGSGGANTIVADITIWFEE